MFKAEKTNLTERNVIVTASYEVKNFLDRWNVKMVENLLISFKEFCEILVAKSICFFKDKQRRLNSFLNVIEAYWLSRT